jgi:hypothetical protein
MVNSLMEGTMWHIDPLLGNDCKTNETTAIARQPVCQWTCWKVVFSAWHVSMAVRATMAAVTKEWCFLCGPCPEVTNETAGAMSRA